MDTHFSVSRLCKATVAERVWAGMRIDDAAGLSLEINSGIYGRLFFDKGIGTIL